MLHSYINDKTRWNGVVFICVITVRQIVLDVVWLIVHLHVMVRVMVRAVVAVLIVAEEAAHLIALLHVVGIVPVCYINK